MEEDCGKFSNRVYGEMLSAVYSTLAKFMRILWGAG